MTRSWVCIGAEVVAALPFLMGVAVPEKAEDRSLFGLD
jgi:hypothetical protein